MGDISDILGPLRPGAIAHAGEEWGEASYRRHVRECHDLETAAGIQHGINALSAYLDALTGACMIYAPLAAIICDDNPRAALLKGAATATAVAIRYIYVPLLHRRAQRDEEFVRTHDRQGYRRQ
jgi:hypothetical protein